ncbi:unnamed protein product [Kuraishia capsulata CBS 1993]|uniref:TauD/TfdA-like domain-containing protein n=1 Tax=Kuraishia capsulata CBS 1993 TaxID=1382522 RepID=W6MH11_9ASCO|nr:uncharacterized protein KUCA_T00001178001 [Kuraishia capsulata CBS 1993]CDK25211.1 unnamed protein product [Kuraishia capsulata CBS 1993]
MTSEAEVKPPTLSLQAKWQPPKEPLKPTGALDRFFKQSREQLTPAIGDQYASDEVQLSNILKAPNADEILRDLAIVISRRNVVFFKNQNLTPAEQNYLVNRLGQLSGKPATSGLHIDPNTPEHSQYGDNIYEVTRRRNDYSQGTTAPLKISRSSQSWHTDISYEQIPSDYAAMKVVLLPENGVGGDTVFASGYYAYEKLSPRFRKLVDGLQAPHDGYRMKQNATNRFRTERGAPENNNNMDIVAVHPIIRTNPVTGWKSIYLNKQTPYIEGVTQEESDAILEIINRAYIDNHDIQVRYKWGENDIALWDNRCSVHTATVDYTSDRFALRTLSLGERPYFDPNSKSISEE